MTHPSIKAMCPDPTANSPNSSATTVLQRRNNHDFTLIVQALRLEPYLVISNQTGVPLQLMQPRGGTIQQSFAGIVPSRATRDGLPRVGVPPAGRSYTGQGPPPEGLRTAISAADADYTSTVDLPTGGSTLRLCVWLQIRPTCPFTQESHVHLYTSLH